MLTYNLVHDEGEIRKFFRTWIQPYMDRLDAEQLIFMLYVQARKKYDPKMSTGQVILDRILYRVKRKGEGYETGETRFVGAVRSLEIKQGLYIDLDTGEEIRDEGIVIYMTMEPGNELKAWFKLEEEMHKRISDYVLNDSVSKTGAVGLESLFKTSLVRAVDMNYLKLDVDTKDPEKILALLELIKEQKIVLKIHMETRGGYHMVMRRDEMSKEASKMLHEFRMSNGDWVTIEKVAMLVVAGTRQGGFPTRLL